MHDTRSIREHTDNSNMHTNLITGMLQCCFQAPYINFVIQSSTGETISVREYDESPDFVVMPKRVSHLLVGLEVPNANWAVPWCADKMAFIGSKTDGSNDMGMTPQNGKLPSINRPPSSDSVIRWPRENMCTILGPTQRPHLAIMFPDLGE
jgi:hypothetical protein